MVAARFNPQLVFDALPIAVVAGQRSTVIILLLYLGEAVILKNADYAAEIVPVVMLRYD